MAKNERGHRGAVSGRRAAGESRGRGTSGARPGRKSDPRYPLRGAAARAAEDVPCPARGRHEAGCICGGTGKVKGTK